MKIKIKTAREKITNLFENELKNINILNIETHGIYIYEHIIVSRSKDVNFLYWHKGLLEGHDTFTFNGDENHKVYLTEENVDLFTYTIYNYYKIVEILENLNYKSNSFVSLHELILYEDELKKFLSVINEPDSVELLSSYDKDLVDLIIYNIAHGTTFTNNYKRFKRV